MENRKNKMCLKWMVSGISGVIWPSIADVHDGGGRKACGEVEHREEAVLVDRHDDTRSPLGALSPGRAQAAQLKGEDARRVAGGKARWPGGGRGGARLHFREDSASQPISSLLAALQRTLLWGRGRRHS
ncbi:uncharacterized protein RHO17_015800 [Thomomys bottae]